MLAGYWKIEKIPYKFSYEFLCQDPQCKKHKMMIEDWEVYALYRNVRIKYDEKEALIKALLRGRTRTLAPLQIKSHIAFQISLAQIHQNLQIIMKPAFIKHNFAIPNRRMKLHSLQFYKQSARF